MVGPDLLGNVGTISTNDLALRAQGNDQRMELIMTRTGSNAQPCLAALAALTVPVSGLWISRRR